MHDGSGVPDDVGDRVLVQHRMGTVCEHVVAALAKWEEDPWTWFRPGPMDIVAYDPLVDIPRLSLSLPAKEQGFE